MKVKLRNFFYLATIFSFALILFSSCQEEDNNCRLKVKVQDLNDPSIVISGVKIDISKEAGSVKATGYSDMNGEALFTFDYEAILDINVVKEVDDTLYERKGKSTVRLIPGETVEKQVLLHEPTLKPEYQTQD
ncbi:MAG: hypothetical protein LBM25_06750 [Bacteroidales bacterium]|jgi:hypothetical protein|nr:hypothetical protein [Bacteroidales bacterium]